MANLKSVFEIEVNRKEFDNYKRAFDAYQTALKTHPGIWKTVGKEVSGLSAAHKQLQSTMESQAKRQQQLLDFYKGQNRQLQQGDKLWQSMAKSAGGLASSILSATRTLLSWSGVVGAVTGLLGAGGLFGIDRMARGVADARKSSMGLGMSIGQKEAFRLTFGARAVDTDSYLGWINSMEMDPRKAAAASALGVGLSGDTSKDAVALLRAIRGRAKGMGAQQAGMLPEMFNLEGVSGQDVRRLMSLSESEFGGLEKQFGPLSKKLDIGDPTAKKWTEFVQALDVAKGKIWAVFVNGLAPLEGPLRRLSGSLTNLVSVVMDRLVKAHAIEKLGSVIDTFAKYLGSDKFISDIDRFTAKVGELADDADEFAGIFKRFIHPWDNLKDLASNAKSFLAPSSKDLESHSGLYSNYLWRVEARHGLPSGLLSVIKGLEKSGSKDISPAGAMGSFQVMPGTSKQYGPGLDPMNAGEAPEIAARFLDHLETKYKGDIRKVLAAYHSGEGNVDKAIAKGGANWISQLGPEGRQYVLNANPLLKLNGITVNVNVNTPPGGDYTATAAAVAH